VRASRIVYSTGLLATVLVVAGCAGQRPIEPIPGVRFTDVLAVGRELGMTAQRDPVTQAIVLTDAANQVVICPGTAVALVNGKFVDLGRPARYHAGRLVVPVVGLRRITRLLKPRPVARRERP